jgi:hypothetical protein
VNVRRSRQQKLDFSNWYPTKMSWTRVQNPYADFHAVAIGNAPDPFLHPWQMTVWEVTSGEFVLPVNEAS